MDKQSVIAELKRRGFHNTDGLTERELKERLRIVIYMDTITDNEENKFF